MTPNDQIETAKKKVRVLFEKSFSDFSVDEIFYWPIFFIATRNIEWPTLHYIVVVIKSLFNDRNHYRLRHKPGAKLLFFNHTDRLDHMQSFQKVISLVPNEDVAQVDVSAGRFARPGKILRRVGQLLRWLKNLGKSGLTWREFWFVVPFAQLAQEAKEQFEQWDLSYYRAVIFYYDFNWVPNILLQMARKKGIKTITLQHGHFSTYLEFPNEEGRIKHQVSVADEFLAWNEQEKQVVENTGFPSQAIKVMGIPRYLDEPFHPMEQGPRKGIFGVISTIAPKTDLTIIQIACEIAEQTGWKFYVRYHPHQQGDDYDHFFSSPYYLGNGGGCPLARYAEQVDFSLVGQSTVLIDLLHMGKRVYHYCDGKTQGEYPQQENAFTSATQVLEMERELKKTEIQWMTLRGKLSGPADARQRYINYFKELEEKECLNFKR